MSTLEKEKYLMLTSALVSGSLLDLYTFLSNLKINPVTVHDQSANTLIQVCALKNLPDKAELLIQYTKKYWESENIPFWLNHKNKEHLTALHISITSGTFVSLT